MGIIGEFLFLTWERSDNSHISKDFISQGISKGQVVLILFT